jgi:hypothetical protein
MNARGEAGSCHEIRKPSGADDCKLAEALQDGNPGEFRKNELGESGGGEGDPCFRIRRIWLCLCLPGDKGLIELELGWAKSRGGTWVALYNSSPFSLKVEIEREDIYFTNIFKEFSVH